MTLEDVPPRRTRGLPLRFPDYAAFQAYVRNHYVPLPHELSDPSAGYAPGVSWAWRGAPRFFRALRAVSGHVRDGGTLLDIGAYPGSFARLARVGFGDGLRVLTCGMPVRGDYAASMAAEGIPFDPCNLDPDIVSPVALPVGLPYGDATIDVITCMEVVEHLYSLKTLLTDIKRVLRPGGVVYITTNNVADRDGLLRAVRDQETNLDRDLDLTSIWSGHDDQWRGHVRFYSPGQLADAGARAGLSTVRTDYFQVYEDPDVYPRTDRGLTGAVRARLRGDGGSPPRNPRQMLRAVLHLGFRALSRRFDSHLEIVLKAPG